MRSFVLAVVMFNLGLIVAEWRRYRTLARYDQLGLGLSLFGLGIWWIS